MPLPEERYRCKALTFEGKRCPFHRLPGTPFCRLHFNKKLTLTKLTRENRDGK